MTFSHAALILIDLQNDFCTGGALAVPNGEDVIPIANQLQQKFNIIIATQDWHPTHHGSFVSQHPNKQVGEIITLNDLPQIIWPDHCVQHTYGAEFHPDLQTEHLSFIVQKGTDPNIDSYSAFFDNAHLKSTTLTGFLQHRQINEIFLMGLATDYCVKFSVLDAIALGYKVNVIVDGCRGINLQDHDVEQAFAEMKAKGARLILANEVC